MYKISWAIVGVHFLLALSSIVVGMPFLWMLSTALKPHGESMMMPFHWFPSELHWANFSDAWQAAPFIRYFINSMLVTICVTIGELITSVLAAFAFARFRFIGKNIFFCVLLGTMMVPGELLLIPNFVTISYLGWTDHYAALIVPWLSGATAIYFLRTYFQECPEVFYEIAKLEGASNLSFIFLVQIPLSAPALVALASMKIIASWNSYIWPLLVTNTSTMRSVQLGLLAFSTENGTLYELLMAASCFVILPVIMILIGLEKYIVQAITLSNTKG